MGTCNINHSHEDVVKKFESQEEFLPEPLVETLHRFLKNEHSQKILNELFHLLKKYDLASKNEQDERNKKLTALTS
jgi:hypothetical protein